MVAHRGGITAARWAQGLITAYQGAALPYTYQGAACHTLTRRVPCHTPNLDSLDQCISVILKTPTSGISVVAL